MDEGTVVLPGGSDVAMWEKRLVLAPKTHVQSLLDSDVADDRVALHMLRAIQRVALAEDLKITASKSPSTCCCPGSTRIC